MITLHCLLLYRLGNLTRQMPNLFPDVLQPIEFDVSTSPFACGLQLVPAVHCHNILADGRVGHRISVYYLSWPLSVEYLFLAL